MQLKGKDILMAANCFRAILGNIRKEFQRREAPGKSVAGELLAERRDGAGHD